MCISDDFVEFGDELTLPGEVDLPPGYDWERSRIMNKQEEICGDCIHFILSEKMEVNGYSIANRVCKIVDDVRKPMRRLGSSVCSCGRFSRKA